MFGTAEITIGNRPQVCHPMGLTAEIIHDLLHITLIAYDSVLMVMKSVSARPKHFQTMQNKLQKWLPNEYVGIAPVWLYRVHFRTKKLRNQNNVPKKSLLEFKTNLMVEGVTNTRDLTSADNFPKKPIELCTNCLQQSVRTEKPGGLREALTIILWRWGLKND